MKSTFFSVALFGAAVLCAPGTPPAYGSGSCITLSKAKQLVGYYSDVIAQRSSPIGNATETALKIVVPKYTEYSDSASEQIGLPIGPPITTSAQDFATASQSQPAAVFNTLGIYTVECNKILWRWVQPNDGGPDSAGIEVKGFHLFELNSALTQLQLTYFEFNGLAAAIDTQTDDCQNLGGILGKSGSGSTTTASAAAAAAPTGSSTPAQTA